MNKKRVVICCTIGLGLLIFGGVNFELFGIDSTAKAIAVALSITLGLVLPVYGFYGLGLSNDKTTANKGEKPMAKKKQNLMKDEQDAVLSVDLMKREKELETRRKEIESLLAEVTKEEKAVEKRLLEKGWVQKDGVWGIE